MIDIFARVSQLREQGVAFSLATIVNVEGSTPRDAGSRMIVYGDGTTEGTIGGGGIEKQVIEDGVRLLGENRSERITYDLGTGGEGVTLDMACGGRTEVLIEPFKPSIKVFVFGVGHIGRVLAKLCTMLGFPYWIIDNRSEYAVKESFSTARQVLCTDFKESFSKLPIDKRSYIVIVTYGHRFDAVCLEEALKTEAAYIGMIGSKNKVRSNFKLLKEKGVAVSDPRVFAPIGLAIGDNSPEEIGVSIIAEIVKLKSAGSAGHMRETLKNPQRRAARE